MEKSKEKKFALVKNNFRLVRRILVGISQDERRELLEDVKNALCVAIENVELSIQTLRREHGILVPQLKPEWDVIPTELPTAFQTISAYEGINPRYV